MPSFDWKKEIFTIPNLLSLFRLLLIPVYVVIYLNATEPSHYYLSAGILAVSCLTDLIDGKIARHFHMVSTVGKLLDPLADKATQFTLILCLAIRYPVLWYLVAPFVLKELFQLFAVVGFAYKKGKMIDGALPAGKICTTVLFVSLILLVMFPTIPLWVVTVITVIDGATLLYAFIEYFLGYFGKKRNKTEDIVKPNQ